MKYAKMRGHLADRTKKGNLTKRAAKALATVAIPPATPAREGTGQPADNRGGTHWQQRLQASRSNGGTTREARRINRFGRYGVQPMRSRIQRGKRKQRTGGVK